MRPDHRRAPARAIFATAFTAVTTVLAILVGSNTMSLFENIILILLYLLIPWTAINLTDYYLVRRGRYDVDAFFLKDGPYGRCNWGAVVIFLLSIAVEVPFFNTTVYEGPLARGMGGADISWLVGLAFGAVTYYLYSAFARRGVAVEVEPVAVSAIGALAQEMTGPTG